jgi:hypothetical protein
LTDIEANVLVASFDQLCAVRFCDKCSWHQQRVADITINEPKVKTAAVACSCLTADGELSKVQRKLSIFGVVQECIATSWPIEVIGEIDSEGTSNFDLL